MRPRIHVVLLLALASAVPGSLCAQDEMSLGDVARSLRKSQSPPKTVIDNDNLSAVMEEGETRKWALSEPSRMKPIQLVDMASPDVTCALSFSAQPDPLAEQPQNLPEAELAKLDGPATLAGSALQISVHNGSSWDVREITVSFTIVRQQQDPPPPPIEYDAMNLVPTMVSSIERPQTGIPAPVEKLSDVTVLYHLKGTAAPSSTIVVHETLSAPLSPEQEWHWSIVQAKGIPPAPVQAPGN
jgi:hypothetical protein